MHAQSERLTVLAGIKFLQTLIWLFFAGCIVGIPVAGARHQYFSAALLTGLVLVDCAVLAVNRCRCPLTNLAGRYTEERASNFDIYLPLWLARRNKAIFGTLFAVGELLVLGQWLTSSRVGALSPGVAIPTPWECRWSKYERHDGMCIPNWGEVAWLLPEGLQPYFRGGITSVSYEFAQ